MSNFMLVYISENVKIPHLAILDKKLASDMMCLHLQVLNFTLRNGYFKHRHLNITLIIKGHRSCYSWCLIFRKDFHKIRLCFLVQIYLYIKQGPVDIPDKKNHFIL